MGKSEIELYCIYGNVWELILISLSVEFLRSKKSLNIVYNERVEYDV